MDEDWPTELRLGSEGRSLAITFESGAQVELAAEYLRVESPSAEVQGHSAAEKKTVSGKQNIRIKALDPIGNYAVKVVFSDGHDTGLFTWRYLRQLGDEHDTRWPAYLAALSVKDLSR